MRTVEIVKESQLTPSTACSETPSCRSECGLTLSNTWPYLSGHISSTYGGSAVSIHAGHQDAISPPVDMRRQPDRLSHSSRSVISPCLLGSRTVPDANQREEAAVNLALNRGSVVSSDLYPNGQNGFNEQASPASAITSSMTSSDPMRPPVSHARVMNSASRSINEIANSLRIPLVAGPEVPSKQSQEEVTSPSSNPTSNGSMCMSPAVTQGNDESLSPNDDEIVS